MNLSEEEDDGDDDNDKDEHVIEQIIKSEDDDILDIFYDDDNLSDEQLKPGQKKRARSREEAMWLKIRSLRMQKSRILKNLKKIVIKLREQVYEPLDTLFILYEHKTRKFKYFGSGELVRKFEDGEVLMKDKQRQRSRIRFVEPVVTVKVFKEFKP